MIKIFLLFQKPIQLKLGQQQLWLVSIKIRLMWHT